MMLEIKVCTKCGKEKDIDNFRKNGFSNGKQRYKSKCKICMSKNSIGPEPCKEPYKVPISKVCTGCNKDVPIDNYPLKGKTVAGLPRYRPKCKDCFYKTSRRVGESQIQKKVCPNCNKKEVKVPNIYCDTNCHREFEFKERIRKWKAGELTGHTSKSITIAKWLRRYLLQQANFKCSKCSFEGYNEADGNTILEIDHIDGDPENCIEDNLAVLCPNCHAKTPTYKARNKNSKRARYWQK